jgi:calcineurin-like phosphoesterase family protein
MIYFSSDNHFNSKRALDLSLRPFKSVEQMNKKMVSNWNKVVNNDDIIYILGDFGDYKYLSKLNGKIIFLLDNHEWRDIGKEKNLKIRKSLNII